MTERRFVSPETASNADAPRAVLAGILATGLAAALGAVLTSYVGVQGTVAGAMVGACTGLARLPSDAVRKVRDVNHIDLEPIARGLLDLRER